MSGILFFIFASCEPLNSKPRWSSLMNNQVTMINHSDDQLGKKCCNRPRWGGTSIIAYALFVAHTKNGLTHSVHALIAGSNRYDFNSPMLYLHDARLTEVFSYNSIVNS